MKNNKRMKRILIIAGILLFLIILKSFGGIFENNSKFKGETEKIYREKRKLPKDVLVKELKKLESEIKNDADKIELLPYYQALEEKAKEFSPGEVIEELEKEKTKTLYAETLVRIYKKLKADPNKIKHLLLSNQIDEDLKHFIIAQINFEEEFFEKLFYKNNDALSIIAMQKIMHSSELKAFEISKKFLLSEFEKLSPDKIKAINIGISNYYRMNLKDSDLKVKKDIRNKLLKLLDNYEVKKDINSKESIARDSMVYTLLAMKDFEIFKRLFYDNNFDQTLRVTMVLDNVKNMKEILNSKVKEKDLKIIIDAMRAMPITEVGEKIIEAIKKGFIKETEEVKEILLFIEKEGSREIDK